ncbi:hypothetical protein M5K25_024288 [Dendrobium thyrsiflorum]|uniref:Uncharacterized protein n=1 Tax=Dendrobium thyrsiflorum TaxID=117978 RepID=A0ABD0U1T0_DENTH
MLVTKRVIQMSLFRCLLRIGRPPIRALLQHGGMGNRCVAYDEKGIFISISLRGNDCASFRQHDNWFDEDSLDSHLNTHSTSSLIVAWFINENVWSKNLLLEYIPHNLVDLTRKKKKTRKKKNGEYTCSLREKRPVTSFRTVVYKPWRLGVGATGKGFGEVGRGEVYRRERDFRSHEGGDEGGSGFRLGFANKRLREMGVAAPGVVRTTDKWREEN